jgi:hypothetical protein
MKSRLSFFERSLAFGLALIVAGACTVATAQEPVQPGAQQPPAPTFSPQQLDNLVAPIALYSDPLISQVLVACTYPLEVVEAQQWLQRNPGLKGQALMDAARQHDWDPSVQAMVALPDVMARLNQDIRWTTDLGNAFLAQQADVMSAIQRMRGRAEANGRLSSTPQQTVTTQTDNGQSAIVIQPADPQVIYVPTYDPMYVWGPPAWGYYPSLYYPAFGFGWGPGFDVGLYFGGWGFGGWGGWGGWGWGPNWFGRNIFVNHAFFRNYGFRGYGGGFGGRGIWAHDPTHRLGVAYPNRQLAGRFQAASRMSAASVGRRDSFGQSFGGNRGTFQGQAGRQFGNRYSGQGQSYGANRGTFQGQAGGRFSGQGNQSFRNAAPQGSMRNFQTAPRYQSRPSYQPAPRVAAPGYGGGGARSYGGGGARSFNGGGGGHSFAGGGGGGHSFGGGGGHSFSGGGGGHSGGGGGHGGGGGGHRR